MSLGDRDTGDLVVLILAAVLGVVAMVAALTVLAVAVFDPGRDLGEAVDALIRFLGVVVGVVVGFVAGRSPARRRASDRP